MSWDPLWEAIFRSQDWGRYPPEELIRYTARNFYRVPNRKDIKILEIGCGMGANVWYFTREGFTAYGMDGAPTAIEKAKQWFAAEGIEADLRVGDAFNLIEMYPTSSFDMVVDVGCLQCNKLGAVQQMVDQAYQLLKPDGHFFSIMAAVESIGYGLGTEVEPGTFVEIADGPTAGRGLNHFFTIPEVEQIFSAFRSLNIEYSMRSLNQRQDFYKNWVVNAQK